MLIVFELFQKKHNKIVLKNLTSTEMSFYYVYRVVLLRICALKLHFSNFITGILSSPLLSPNKPTINFNCLFLYARKFVN